MAEAPSNRLLPSGHDEEFVSEVEDDFQCLICHLPLKEPILTRCGHRCCKECLEEHFRRQEVQAQPLTCPADRAGLDRDRDVFPDKATGRKILSFAIKCPSEDCDWTGELRNKEAHLETCPSKVVSCINENCHMTLKRKDLEQHVTITCEWRIIECEYCNDPHPECHMQNHIEKCNKFPLSCPNSCDDSIPREMIPNHIENDCPLTLVSCPYVQMGCNEKVQRKSISSHLKLTMGEHLDFACLKLNDTQVLLNETRAQLCLTQETTKSLEEKVATLQKQLELKGKTESLTQNQLSNTQEYTRNLKMQMEALQRQLKINTNTDNENNNTRFIWKINKFSEILSQAKAVIKEAIISDPFYTERYGYKLQVMVYPNGLQLSQQCRKNTLSVIILIEEGEYDAMLPWPFQKKVTFTLIDQQENPGKRENVVSLLSPKWCKQELFSKRPKGANNVVGCTFDFISHEKLQTRRYLVDDTLFLQVDIGLP